MSKCKVSRQRISKGRVARKDKKKLFVFSKSNFDTPVVYLSSPMMVLQENADFLIPSHVTPNLEQIWNKMEPLWNKSLFHGTKSRHSFIRGSIVFPTWTNCPDPKIEFRSNFWITKSCSLGKRILFRALKNTVCTSF